MGKMWAPLFDIMTYNKMASNHWLANMSKDGLAPATLAPSVS